MVTVHGPSAEAGLATGETCTVAGARRVAEVILSTVSSISVMTARTSSEASGVGLDASDAGGVGDGAGEAAGATLGASESPTKLGDGGSEGMRVFTMVALSAVVIWCRVPEQAV